MSFAEFFNSKKVKGHKPSHANTRYPLIDSPSESASTTNPIDTSRAGGTCPSKAPRTKVAATNKRGKTKRTDDPSKGHIKSDGASHRHNGAKAHKSGGSANTERSRKRHHDQNDRGPESSLSPPGSRRNRSMKRSRTGSALNPSKSVKKLPPTPESLELMERLRWLSRHKLAGEAADAFWDVRYESARDSHHACMLVGCCARAAYPGCDATVVDSAERAVDTVTTPTHPASVELQTALIKLYARAGLLSRASTLFKSMCQANARKPNVRTLNTLLRGCLWNAAVKVDSIESDCKRNSGSRKPARASWRGCVTIAEDAWSLYRETVGTTVDAFDASSYEYSVLLLCQSLNVLDAQTRAEELQTQYGIRIKGKATFTAATGLTESSSDAFETLAVVHLALARSYALLGRMHDTWLSCQRALSAVAACQKCRRELGTGEAKDVGSAKTGKAQANAPHGGKRAWKSSSQGSQAANEQQRQHSNAAYREHRLTELQDEARALLRLRRDQQEEEALSPALLWNRLSTCLFVFHPGGDASRQTAALASDVAAWDSFGGCKVGEMIGKTSPEDLGHKDLLRKSGTIKVGTVFCGHERANAPLDVELGSGYGDWIVHTAASEPGRNHVAVEVRSDRVFQIFAKAMLSSDGRPLANLCVVGSDAGSFLRHRLEQGCVSTMYVHHPEPPTQSFGGNQADLDTVMESTDGHSEPNHMLRSETIIAAARALKPDGKLVVVTDNRNYARLVCATLAKVARTCPQLIRSPTAHELEASGLRRSHETPRLPVLPSCASIAIFEKRHDTTSGGSSSSGGSTWFDRLWRTAGASSRHAEQHTRYVILMYRFNAAKVNK